MFSKKFTLATILVFFGILVLQTDMGYDRIHEKDDEIKREVYATSKKKSKW